MTINSILRIQRDLPGRGYEGRNEGENYDESNNNNNINNNLY